MVMRLAQSFYFVADMNGVACYQMYPLGIFDAGNYLCVFTFVFVQAETYTGFDVVFGYDGCAAELRVLPFYVVDPLRFERSVFVGELEFVPFVEKRQHGNIHFHIILQLLERFAVCLLLPVFRLPVCFRVLPDQR